MPLELLKGDDITPEERLSLCWIWSPSLKGEKFKLPVNESEADKLLRKDLMQKVSQFRRFGKDSLILGVLAYNVGEGKLLGLGSHSKALSKRLNLETGT